MSRYAPSCRGRCRRAGRCWRPSLTNPARAPPSSHWRGSRPCRAWCRRWNGCCTGAIRKEALLTSQIEGTQATLIDLFDEEAGLAVANTDDVEEVSNYLRAFRLVRDNLHRPRGLPISVRLLRDAHRELLAGARGTGKQPGELRRSQSWVGGSRPGNTVFVPPPADRVPALLADLEQFIHAPKPKLPPLVRVALVYVQFETIHPFLDGNGRIGRLLIAVLMEAWGLLPEPLMYLSGYLNRHQREYYRLLSEVRTDGDWESWIGFFLGAVEAAASEAERAIVDIATLVNADRRRLLAAPGVGVVALRVFELLPVMPRFNHRAGAPEAGDHLPDRHAGGEAAGDAGHRERTHGAEEESQLRLHSLMSNCWHAETGPCCFSPVCASFCRPAVPLVRCG